MPIDQTIVEHGQQLFELGKDFTMQGIWREYQLR